MTREGFGWCPFAQQVEGVFSYTPEHLANVGFCDHTAGGFMGTMLNPNFWNGRNTSVHFAIARDGRIAQFVNIFHSAFAQGRDSTGMPVGPDSPGVTWVPFNAMGRQNPNLYLVSTEHEDAETVNGQTRFIPGSQWTQAQYDADLRVKRWVVEECKKKPNNDALKFGLDSLASHHMFDPVNRKECAGRFWRNEYRESLWRDLSMTNKPVPSTTDQIVALLALAHFLRNGWNLDDLSKEDKAAIEYAVLQVPGLPGYITG